jgi:hypothetical protein
VARMSLESLEDKLLAAPARASAPEAAAPPSTPEAAAPPSAPEAVAVPAPKDGLDIPVLPVVGVVAAAFAAATFSMRSGKKDREAEQSSSPAPAPAAKAAPAPAPAAKADAPDISIPYDAAARLAYDESDKSMEYSEFKEKYQADTVAFIKAKQTK